MLRMIVRKPYIPREARMQTACKIAARDAFARSHQQLQHWISRLQSAES